MGDEHFFKSTRSIKTIGTDADPLSDNRNFSHQFFIIFQMDREDQFFFSY